MGFSLQGKKFRAVNSRRKETGSFGKAFLFAGIKVQHVKITTKDIVVKGIGVIPGIEKTPGLS
jgi:hypothetical protein